MKNLFMALCLSFGTTAFAKTLATDAFEALLPAGTYQGNGSAGKCTVTITTQADSVVVSVEAKNERQLFAVLNSASNYLFDDVKNEFAASQSLNFPRYDHGGTKHLLVRENDIEQVEVYVSEILFDHRGNDASTYLNCIVTK